MIGPCHKRELNYVDITWLNTNKSSSKYWHTLPIDAANILHFYSNEH